MARSSRTPAAVARVTNLGLARWLSGDGAGRDDLDEAARVASRSGT